MSTSQKDSQEGLEQESTEGCLFSQHCSGIFP